MSDPAANADGRAEPGAAASGSADPEEDLPEVAGELSDLDEVIVEEAVHHAADEVADDEERFVDGTLGRSELAAERDEFRDALLRIKADFDNYKKRVAKDQSLMVARAAEQLVNALLPVLDACEAALAQGATDVEPIFRSLVEALGREGLEPMAAVGTPFDPTFHEAVLHEPGDGGEEVVAEILRSGYLWKGYVLRPAMVKVKG
ncbi:MAG: nucleotide exchange factor GrpE [Acidimicrobiales bacterium]|jgi:molecular chaperone GrpE|nr:nucleotide exchange factor GrpE [Acidimicrobiales bacterium]